MLLTQFRCFFFWLWSKHFCYFVCICCFSSTQFSLVIISQISDAYSKSLPSFIIIDFDEATEMQCLVLFILYILLVSIFSGRDLFQVRETDAGCVFYMICFQLITFKEVMLYSAYCAWFIALLASPYAVLFHTCLHLFLANFHSSAYISIQFELHWPVQS